jgi:hypothetical protein
VFLFIILVFEWSNIKDKLSSIFLSNKKNKKSEYICPKCGSKDWKFPNPIKPAESTINIYNLVNQFLECKSCGHIGIFYATDDNKNLKLTLNKPEKRKNNKKISLTLFGWVLFILIFIIAFFSPNLLWMVIIFMAGMSLINKFGVK